MAFIGSCQDMCPQSERQTRYGLYMSMFEKDDNNQPNEFAMVKEYRRSGADQEEPSPEDLRTIEALELTMNHLLYKIMDDPRSKQQDTAIEWYDFLWDRLRAIRKDITQQNICDERTASLVERCARFHVHTCYALNGIKEFDVELNKRNLNDCLQMLRQIYSDLRTASGTVCRGEVEFQKYDILLHLNDDQLSSTILMKTSDHRSSEDMQFLIKIFSAYTNNDYYRFFRLMERADYMTSCILSLYANKMRLEGIKMIANACSTARQVALYPVNLIIECLGFDGLQDLKAFTSKAGINIQVKDDKEYLLLSRDLIMTIRRAEHHLEPFKSSRLVESKMGGKLLGQLVHEMNCSWDRPLEPNNSEATPLPEFSPQPEEIYAPKLQDEVYFNSIGSSTQEQQMVEAPIHPKEVIGDDLKWLEQQVVALEEEAAEESYEVCTENVEPELNEFLARAIRKRSCITRDQIADMMPAGRLKIATLASKRPTLKVPDESAQQVVTTPKRRRTSLEAKRTIESYNNRVQDEVKVNKIFEELASIITQ